MKNNKEQWNEYLSNPNVRPKVFSADFERAEDGTFRVIGHTAYMVDVVNQHQSKLVKVDARDLASALNKSKISAL